MKINRTKDGRRGRDWLKGLLFLAFLGLAPLAVLSYGPLGDLVHRTTRFLMDHEGARAWVLSHQPYSAVYFIALQVFQVVFSPIPGEFSGFLGGYIFGWVQGFIYSTIGLTLGSLGAVSIGRAFERVVLEKILPARVLDEFGARVHRWGLATVFILFLIPGAPKDYMSYLFGLSRISILNFLVVSAVARMPGTLALSLQGDKVFEGDWTFFIVLTGVSLAVLLPLFFLRERIFVFFGIKDRTQNYQ